MQSKNFLTQLSTILRKANTNYSQVAYYKNPDSLLDKGIILLWILAGFTLLLTGSFGIYYHKTIFLSSFGGWSFIAGLFSISLFVIAEIMKVFAGLTFLRLLFTGAWYKSLAHVGITIVFAAIVGGAFFWSYHVSSEATSKLTEDLKTSDIYRANEFDAPTLTSDIQNKLNDIQAEKNSLKKQTNKSGEILWPALQAINKLTEQEIKLQDEKALILDQSKNRASNIISAEIGIVKRAALQLAEYGGKSEILLAIVLIGIALIETIAYQNNLQHFQTTPDKTPAKQPDTTPAKQPEDFSKQLFAATAQTSKHNGSILNQTGATIGFKMPVASVSNNAESVVKQGKQAKQQPVSNTQTVVKTLVANSDLTYLKQLAQTHYKRSLNSATETARADNKQKYLEEKQLLETAGITVTEDDTRLIFSG